MWKLSRSTRNISDVILSRPSRNGTRHPVYELAARSSAWIQLSSTHFFSTSRSWQEDAPKATKNKPHKKIRPVSKASLNRTALGAKLDQPNEHAARSSASEPNLVTAYCVAQEYDMDAVNRILRQRGLQPGSSGTLLYPDEPQVIHIEMPLAPFKDEMPHVTTSEPVPTGDIFIFPSGTVVSWSVPRSNVEYLISDVLQPAAKDPLRDEAEDEDLDWMEESNEERSFVRGETIMLGTKTPKGSSGVASHNSARQAGPRPMRVVLAKIAFSSGLARATKLSVLENLVDEYSQSSRNILAILTDGSPIARLKSRRWVYQRLGRLLDLRAQLNLYSELADDLPDLLWDTEQELGLESCYDQVGRALDVVQRVRILNQKMDYAEEIISHLRDMRSEIHSSRLEWIIIGLITFEVLYTIWREVRHLPAAAGKGVEEGDGRGLTQRG